MKKGLLKTKDQSIDGFVREAKNFIRDKDVVRIRDGFLNFGELSWAGSKIYPLKVRNVWIGNEEFVLFFSSKGDLFAYPVGRDIPNSGALNLYKVARHFEYTDGYGNRYDYYFPEFGAVENNVAEIVETKKHVYVLTNARQWAIIKDGIVRFDDDNHIVLFDMKEATITDMTDDEYRPYTLSDITGNVLSNNTVRFSYRSELGGRGKATRDYVVSATKPIIGLPNTGYGWFILDRGRLQLPVIGYVVRNGDGLEPPYDMKIFAIFDDVLQSTDSTLNSKDDSYIVWSANFDGTLSPQRTQFTTATWNKEGYYIDSAGNYGNIGAYNTAETLDVLIEITPSGKKYLWTKNIDELSMGINTYALVSVNERLYMVRFTGNYSTTTRRYWEDDRFIVDTANEGDYHEIETEFNGDGIFTTAFFDTSYNYTETTSSRFFKATIFKYQDSAADWGIITKDVEGYAGVSNPLASVNVRLENIQDFNIWKYSDVSGTSFGLITRDGAVYIGQNEDNVVVYGKKANTGVYKAPEIWLNDETVISGVEYAYAVTASNWGITPSETPYSFIKLPVIATKPSLRFTAIKRPFGSQAVGEWNGVRYHDGRFYFFVQNTVKIANEFLEWSPSDTVYTDGDVLDMANYANGLLVITTQGLYELTYDKNLRLKKISNITNVVKAISSNNSNIVFLQTNTGRFLILIRKYEQGVPQDVIQDISETFYMDAKTWHVYDVVFWEEKLWIATTNGVYVRNEQGDIWRIDIEDPLQFVITRERLMVLTGKEREGIDLTLVDPFIIGGAI